MKDFALTSVFVALLAVLPLLASGQAVNVALSKPVTALYTCGVFGEESFNTLQDAMDSSASQTHRSCADAREPPEDLSHLTANPPSYPPVNMVDGDSSTWWQSTSRSRIYTYGIELNGELESELEAVIDLDLQQEFLVESVTISLGDALTPQRVCIEKSLDGSSFEPWVFAVTNVEWCESEFEVDANTAPTALNGTVCITYFADDTPPGDTISLSFTSISNSLKEWSRVRHLKFKFYDMLFIAPFNALANTYNHYAVSELTVMAECPCNGQQTGCDISATTGMYECVCGGNTRGRYCELCQPLYNQYQFQYEIPCEECNCFNHADSCFYEASVEADGESIDINGEYKGGGVCIDCQHNTDGNNCEECVASYYRPTGVAQTSVDACVPCACNAAGSTINPDTNRVDCVVNDDAERTDGKLPGDCFCKENVEGSKCDTCKSEFYNLQQSNPDGCSTCRCYTSGTVDGNQVCTPDAVGQCTCKANVQGRTCDQCKDGFYGLSGDDANGCTPCNCDVGGAVNQVCDKLTGQCLCRSNNIVGRTCNSVRDQFYFPGPHSIATEFEKGFGVMDWKREEENAGFYGDGYAVGFPGETISFLVEIPASTRLSGDFTAIIRYSSTVGGSLNISVAGQTIHPLEVSLPACANAWCQANSPQAEILQLSPGSNLLNVEIITGDGILLDQFVAYPLEYWDYATVVSDPLPAGCVFLTNERPSDATDLAACDAATFTLTMYYWTAPLACGCDLTGSTGPSCEVNAGQCACRPGVVERTCSRCSLDHYNFGATGCAECSCDEFSTSCDPLTGQCQCPENTFGRQCQYCLPNHWDWHQTEGCKACTCDPVGSASLQCNATTGICTCKTGVEGDNCDVCQDGYHSLGSTGCLPCSCDLAGSENNVCNKTSGQCPCKANTEGTLCNTCKDATFGLGTSDALGCQDCVCMGITTQCSAGTTKFSSQLYALSTRSGGVSVSSIELTNEDGSHNDLPVTVTTELPTTLIIQAREALQRVFWKMPETFTSKLVALYGTDLTFTVNYVIVSGESFYAHEVILISHGVTLTYPAGTVLEGSDTTVTVTLKETAGWVLATSDTPVTRQDFLKYLATASAVLAPASFSTGDFTASLSEISFNVENSAGVANTEAERCECGTEYAGGSCESCAAGYSRVNVSTSDYLGVCSRCDCNGHSDLCDEDTGICLSCLHDTTGDSCETCKDGFYGDATVGTATDCTPCPCYLPRVVNSTCHVNTTTQTVVCDFCQEGYVGDLCDTCDLLYYGNPEVVGGTCLPCECNGNADTCDSVTGVCANCASNTTGDNCETCIDGFYGDASQQTCQECSCQPDTSTSTICDTTTGQCPCVAGVGGRDCSYCLLGYWGFDNTTFLGCQECGCVEAGSTSIQCDNDTGICSCNPNTSGDLCDTCDDGYFGLPTLPCTECGCDLTGTIPGELCDKTDGQCQCQPGVNGRQCDVCQTFFVNFTSEGCDECGVCQQSLGEDIQTQMSNASSVLATADVVKGVQEQDERLQNLTVQLDESLTALGIANSNASSATEIVNDLSATSTQLVADYNTLQSQASTLETATDTLLSDSQAEYARQEDLLGRANSLTLQCNNFEDTLAIYIAVATQYSSSAAQYASDSTGSSTSDLDFASELAEAQLVLLKVQNTASFDATIATVTAQSQELVSLNGTITSLFDELALQDTSITDLDGTVTGIAASLAIADTDLEGAQEYESQASELEQAVTSILTNTEQINTDASAALDSARASVTDTNSVLSGAGSAVMTGEDYFPFPTGVTNYESAVSSLENSLTSLPFVVDVVDPKVVEAEAYLVTLETTLTQLNNSYNTIPAVAMDAALAIQNFEEVIIALENSVTMAAEANTLLEEIRTNVSGEAFEARTQEYEAEKALAEALRTDMNNKDYQTQALLTSIQDETARLDNEPATWATVDMILDQLTESGNTLNTGVQESNLDNQLALASNQVSDAAEAARIVAASVANQEEELDQIEAELNRTEESIEDIQALETTLIIGLAAFNARLSLLESNVETASTLTTNADTTAQLIADKISLVESKLTDAESLLAQLRQPLNFDGSLGLEYANPDSDSQEHLYDELSLELRKPDTTTDGLVFFVEHPDQEDQLQLGIREDKVVFQYSTGSNPVVIESPAEICAGCWFRVDAARYGDVGHLTVTALSNGGSVSISSPDPSVDVTTTISLNSSIFVGTLDAEYDTSKVVNRNFVGCLHNLEYQGEELNLWTTAVATSATATCCNEAAELAGPAIIPGASFNGLGYLVLSPPTVQGQTLLLSQVNLIELEFRSFSSTVTLFLVQAADGINYFAIKLQDGSLVWEVLNSGLIMRSQVAGTFNNGQWVKVQAQNLGGMILTAGFMDTGDPGSMSSTAGTLALTPFDNRDLILGSESNPLVEGYTPTDNNFAGCVRNLILTSTTVGAQTISFTENVVANVGVSPNGCYDEIINGIRFSSDAAYVQFSPVDELQQLNNFSVQFLTEQTSAVLLYVSAAGSSRFLYLAVFGGNILLLHRQDATTIRSIVSTGRLVSDGQLHTVELDMITNRVSMRVDGVTFEESSATLSATYLTYSSTAILSLGGVPADVTLPSECPVKTSLIGGITVIGFNNLYEELGFSNTIGNQDITLAGIAAPPSSAPDPPVTDETTPLDTCPAAPIPSTLALDQGFYLDGSQVVSWTELASADDPVSYMLGSFELAIVFGAYKADGVLLYIANSVSSPTNYFTVYLEDGILSVQMRSSVGEDITVSLAKVYDTSNQVELAVIRINDFVSVTVTAEDDYADSDKDPAVASTFDFTSTDNIYIGGLDTYDVASSSLPSGLKETGSTNFAGAIFSVRLTAEPSSDNFVEFPIGNLDRTTAPAIPDSVRYGAFLAGGASSSYLGLGAESTSASLTVVEVSLTTSSSSGIVFLLYQASPSVSFIAVDVLDNQLRLHLPPTYGGVTSPLIIILDDQADICDSQPHVLEVAIDSERVKMTVDGNIASDQTIPASHTVVALAGAQFYVAGVPDPTPTGLPEALATESLAACVTSVSRTFGSVSATYDPTQYASTSSGIEYGCPY